ncbi:MAG: argininosuccinate lyase [Thermoproteota archaeon]|uniref:Argininosuccinate lyase n=1 Tax=Candidatus Methanodesulfokora washburnensis TaxID=2478471 RepID=A0A429GW74_9CREN|nr:argininosuccinate lyase [Candidatus Methanodesulfokores washburnensis]RSN78015.1 argininosuccinate lyase [Candidatus Methanodesulfokores washburnensis]RZN63116.1 MAG: argininosuccinate lyase [Candidatus Methanodesulfokores washburnensis]TDA41245.1 MAG: argininosuccinate lyase [Candidatus Korarchaeota archaeon]
MSLYRKALLGDTEKKILEFTSSIDIDRHFVEEAVDVMRAHVEHLISINAIPEEAGRKVLVALESVSKEDLLSRKAEDIFEAMEEYLKERVGEDFGWISIGRSRNDHVAAVLRLLTRKYITRIIEEILNLRATLLHAASENLYTLFPSFTHMQPAQISTAAHYLTYIEEELSFYTRLLLDVLELVNRSPLGAAAVTSTLVDIDREELASSLHFSGVVKNSLLATGSRDFIHIVSSILTSLSVFLSRVAEDMIFFSFSSLIDAPREHMATSSLMPHKKNLVTMELVRAWGGKAIGLLTSILAVEKGIPSGYNLDLQEMNSSFIPLLVRTADTISIFEDFISKVRFRQVKFTGTLILTDIAELLSLELKIPYREVYVRIARGMSKMNDPSLDEILSFLKEEFNLDEKVIRAISNPIKLLKRKSDGSPNPDAMRKYIEGAKNKINEDLGLLKRATSGI